MCKLTISASACNVFNETSFVASSENDVLFLSYAIILIPKPLRRFAKALPITP